MLERITERKILKLKDKLPFVGVLLLVTILTSGLAIANSTLWVTSYTTEQPVSSQGDPVISEGAIAFIAYERNVGRDLNGDGDMYDGILAYYDTITGLAVYTKEQPYRLYGKSLAISEGVIAYIVYEYYVGRDLSGDGDRYDFILAYYDIFTGSATYTTEQPYGSDGNSFDIAEGVIAYIAYEYYVGRDLNGDGDTSDRILAYYDISTSSAIYTTEQPYRLYGNSPTISQGVITFIADENNDARDLNGDGDMCDLVLAYYDIFTDSATYTSEQPYGSDGNSLDISEGLISFIAKEYYVGRDLNGDGDKMDNILAYYDISTDSATYTTEQPYWSKGNSPTISRGVITFIAYEGHVGQDLNGDGDTMDNILACYDISTGSVTYTTEQPYWSKGNSPTISENVIAFIAREYYLDQDINGDGDKYDNILAYLTLPVNSESNEIPDNSEASPDEDATDYDADADGSIYSISGLASLIETLIEEASIDKKMKNSLLAKIDNAEASADKDNIDAAVNQLEAMINQVTAQRGKKILDGAADDIIAYTNNVISGFLDQLP